MVLLTSLSTDPPAVLSLRVSDSRIVADGVLGVRLRSPDGAPLPPWDPGAHLEVILPSGEVRQYSLCGEAADRSAYDIAILCVEDGRGGSREAHRVLVEGASVLVRGPRQHFPLAPTASHHLLIAGGIGVTPILAMARRLAGAGAAWSAVYGGRTLDAMAFAEELHALAPARVRLSPQDVHGLLDLGAVMRTAPPGTVAYVCGPRPMIDAALAAADEVEAIAELRFERFGAAAHGAASHDPGSETPARGSFELELRASCLTVVVGADETTLDAIERVSPGYAFSCREGYCGTCEAKVVEGLPDHRDDVLSDAERAMGASMMPCVSRALTPRLVLDI